MTWGKSRAPRLGDNRPMHRLRQRPLIARLVLAWFVWVLGVAVAAPLINPEASARNAMLVCSGAGSVLVAMADADPANGGDPGAAPRPMGLDCPLCAAVAPPPAPALAGAASALPAGPAPWAAHAAPRATRVAAPLPPRGPPAHA
ncbi:MAG: DUF2946 family protein [Rhodoferax sp.]